MKTIATIMTFMLAGFAALPAQAQLAEWITTCGDPEYNAVGTAECPAKRVGNFMKTLDADYFNAMNTGVDNRVMSEVFRLFGQGLSKQGRGRGCRERPVMLLMQGFDLWDYSATLPANASAEQAEQFVYFNGVLNNIAAYVSRGC
ncbi:MAG: hypothetical protein L3J37_07610 [Rhodobacteraceae bacterium]|nr:hypothetical protein [Paracoccaceae bacterium]